MSLINPDKNNFFFDNFCKNNIFKEKIILESTYQRTSISTNETFENEFSSDDEIDFNQDFFPKHETIKFTDMLVDNWKEKIKITFDNLMEEMKKKIEKNS